jgi:ankyrin repeat protein
VHLLLATGLVRDLLKAGAPVDSMNGMIYKLLPFDAFSHQLFSESSQTPLHVAVDHNRLDVVELLLSNGANVNASTKPNLDTPLHLAKSVEMAHVLIDSGASLTSQNAWLQTPLHCACKGGDVQLVERMVSSGAQLDVKDQQGRSALHCCSAGNRDAIAAFLIEARCDIALKDSEGVSALALAESMGFQDVAKVIRAHQQLASQQPVFSAEK